MVKDIQNILNETSTWNIICARAHTHTHTKKTILDCESHKRADSTVNEQ